MSDVQSAFDRGEPTAEMGLAEVLPMLVGQDRVGRLIAPYDDGPTVEVWFEHGRVVAANWGRLQGLAALEMAAIFLPRARFTFSPGHSPTQSFDLSPMDLSSRLYQVGHEGASLTGAIPGPQAVPSVVPARRQSNDPETGRLLDRIDGQRTVVDLVEGRQPLVVLRGLANLAQLGAIRFETGAAEEAQAVAPARAEAVSPEVAAREAGEGQGVPREAVPREAEPEPGVPPEASPQGPIPPEAVEPEAVGPRSAQREPAQGPAHAPEAVEPEVVEGAGVEAGRADRAALAAEADAHPPGIPPDEEHEAPPPPGPEAEARRRRLPLLTGLAAILVLVAVLAVVRAFQGTSELSVQTPPATQAVAAAPIATATPLVSDTPAASAAATATPASVAASPTASVSSPTSLPTVAATPTTAPAIATSVPTPTVLAASTSAAPSPTVLASSASAVATATRTASPVASAAVAAPSAAAGQVLLDETFASGAPGWPNAANSAAFWDATGYHLEPRIAGQHTAVAAPLGASLGDVTVQAMFRKTGGPTGGGYGVILRAQGGPFDGANQGGRYYVFEVGDRGEIGAWRREGDHWVDLQPWMASASVNPSTADNRIEVQARGPQFTFSVNGVQVAQITDPTLASGAVGVFAGGDGNEVLVERFEVTVP